jgi:hypothetical protein
MVSPIVRQIEMGVYRRTWRKGNDSSYPALRRAIQLSAKKNQTTAMQKELLREPQCCSGYFFWKKPKQLQLNAFFEILHPKKRVRVKIFGQGY